MFLLQTFTSSNLIAIAIDSTGDSPIVPSLIANGLGSTPNSSLDCNSTDKELSL